MLIAKLATDLMSEALEKLLGVPTMPHSILLFFPFTATILTKPIRYSLFLHASLGFLIFSLLNGMVPLPLRAQCNGSSQEQGQSSERHPDMLPRSCKKSYMLQDATEHACYYLQQYFCHADEKIIFGHQNNSFSGLTIFS